MPAASAPTTSGGRGTACTRVTAGHAAKRLQRPIWSRRHQVLRQRVFERLARVQPARSPPGRRRTRPAVRPGTPARPAGRPGGSGAAGSAPLAAVFQPVELDHARRTGSSTSSGCRTWKTVTSCPWKRRCCEPVQQRCRRRRSSRRSGTPARAAGPAAARSCSSGPIGVLSPGSIALQRVQDRLHVARLAGRRQPTAPAGVEDVQAGAVALVDDQSRPASRPAAWRIRACWRRPRRRASTGWRRAGCGRRSWSPARTA